MEKSLRKKDIIEQARKKRIAWHLKYYTDEGQKKSLLRDYARKHVKIVAYRLVKENKKVAKELGIKVYRILKNICKML